MSNLYYEDLLREFECTLVRMDIKLALHAPYSWYGVFHKNGVPLGVANVHASVQETIEDFAKTQRHSRGRYQVVDKYLRLPCSSTPYGKMTMVSSTGSRVIVSQHTFWPYDRLDDTAKIWCLAAQDQYGAMKGTGRRFLAVLSKHGLEEFVRNIICFNTINTQSFWEIFNSPDVLLRLTVEQAKQYLSDQLCEI